MYCTPGQLADAKLTRELAQACTPERLAIASDGAMDAALRGTSLAGFEAEDQDAAVAALVVVNKALADADGVIDGYLRMRKPTPYAVPLDPVPTIVSTWARWIARYLVHKDRVNTGERTDPVVRDYAAAVKFLEQVRDGKFSLGAEDPLPPASSGAPEVSTPERQFTMDTLRDFGA